MGKTGKKPMTKSEMLSSIAESADLTKKQVDSVLDALAGLIKKSLGSGGAGVISIYGLMKISAVHKPATVARPVKGVGRYDGTSFTGVGAVNTNHAGVITISTAPIQPPGDPSQVVEEAGHHLPIGVQPLPSHRSTIASEYSRRSSSVFSASSAST